MSMTEVVDEYKPTVSVNTITRNGKNHYRFFHYHLPIKNFSIKNCLGRALPLGFVILKENYSSGSYSQ
jgi:hypothetical protein